MEIKINIEKKYVWVLILVIVAVGLVIAYNTNNPQQMGHTLGEIAGADANNDGVVDQAATAWTTERLQPSLIQYKDTGLLNGGLAFIACDSGYAVLGGGCNFISYGTEAKTNHITDDHRGWICAQYGNGNIKTQAYVTCGKTT